MLHILVLIVIVAIACALACIPGIVAVVVLYRKRRRTPSPLPSAALEGQAVTAKRGFSDGFGGPSGFWFILGPAFLVGILMTALDWDVAIERAAIPRMAAHRSSEAIMDDPILIAQTRGMTQAQRQAHLARLTAKGIHRLSAPEIRKLGKIRYELAKFSPVLCANYWFGDVDHPTVMKATAEATARLSSADYNEFIALCARAAYLELHDQGEPVLVRDKERALDLVGDSLGPRAAEFKRIRALGASATREDGCEGVQMIYEAALSIGDPREARPAFDLLGQ